MINLDRRPEKFELASSFLKKYDIEPYRFSAVNGWELSPEILNEVGLRFIPGMTPLMATTYPVEAKGQPSFEIMEEYGKTYFCHNMSRGSIGCALSHLSVLQDAYDSGYETIWVMEDDIEVIQDPNVLPKLLKKLDLLVGKEGWDVLFTDKDYRLDKLNYAKASGAPKRPDFDCSIEERLNERYVRDEVLNRHFRKISMRFGAHSMIIRRSGIEKLLAYAKQHKIFLAYDLDNSFGVNRFSLCYDVVTNMLGAITDNEEPFYE